MEIKEIEAIIEGLLFASGDLLQLDTIAEIIGIDKKTTRSIIQNMMSSYNNSLRGITIREVNNSFQLATKQEYYEYIKKLFDPGQRIPLSQAAYEVLSIIAYKQPVTKSAIEKIRGVNSDSAINKLLERNYIKECGKLDAPGRPSLYEVTEEFLKSFGIRSVNELPEIDILLDDTSETI